MNFPRKRLSFSLSRERFSIDLKRTEKSHIFKEIIYFLRDKTYNKNYLHHHQLQRRGGFTIYKKMLKRSQQLEDKIQIVRQKLSELPEGKLICSHTGPYCKWECSDGHTKTYIKKKDRALAEKLAAKKYLSALLDDLNHEKISIDLYLKHISNHEPKAEKLLEDSTEVGKLLSPYFSPISKELDEWMKSPYQQNIKYPEQLTQKVGPNESVRSKSEAMIAKVLKENHIPYRYECQLRIGDMEIYPDFTIRHPRTGKMYYWEHFGLLDKADYVRNMNSKMQIYTTNGIMPSVNLITTYENQESPLTFEMIEMLVEYYFL